MKRCRKLFVPRNLKTSIKTENKLRKLKLRAIMPDKARLSWKQGRVTFCVFFAQLFPPNFYIQ